MIQSDLVYFTHTIDGANYGGWYRLLEADCIEVMGVGLMQTLPLNGRIADAVACEVLEQFITTRRRLGHPVPALAPKAKAPAEVHHHCPEFKAQAH